MTPYLNEEYETMQTKRDLVLVNMVPFKGGLRSKGKKRTRLERGMVVMFRYLSPSRYLLFKYTIFQRLC